ncbi:MAG: phosphatidylserine/phosphatidylglycerophosphate/cardiolipin synthase family protein [Planctomycetes bacterium]|nr:phosphatidylserine/phosphatidylglycerophosphate/cardiolipin synthase family protein [Planctomycetota bacterium]
MTSPTLLSGYDAFVDALLAEVAACGPGDRVHVLTYIVEPGESSQRVLGALAGAAERGVWVRLACDATWASWLSRFVERTGTLLPAARRMAAGEQRLRVIARRAYDHSKVALVWRRGTQPVAFLGGINLGDRFRPWRDFALRLEGDSARRVRARLRGEPPAPGVDPEFVLNLPRRGRYDLEATFRALCSDPGVTRLRLVHAYLDYTGAGILRLALAHGARVELVLPRVPNVYPHANAAALSWLRAQGGDLEVRLHPDMIHAKAALFERDGEPEAFLGSCNLKRNSFRLFGELNARVRDLAFCAALAGEFDLLWTEASPAPARLRYGPLRAWVETRFG